MIKSCCDSQRQGAAVEEVLSNPIYRQTAGRLQAEMHALPGQQTVVGLVERVAMAWLETAV